MLCLRGVMSMRSKALALFAGIIGDSIFDSAMSQAAAVSGAAGADLEALRDKARERGSKTKFSHVKANGETCS